MEESQSSPLLHLPKSRTVHLFCTFWRGRKLNREIIGERQKFAILLICQDLRPTLQEGICAHHCKLVAGEYMDHGKEAVAAVLPNEHATTIKMHSKYLSSCLLPVWWEKLLSAVGGSYCRNSESAQSIESDCSMSSCKRDTYTTGRLSSEPYIGLHSWTYSSYNYGTIAALSTFWQRAHELPPLRIFRQLWVSSVV